MLRSGRLSRGALAGLLILTAASLGSYAQNTPKMATGEVFGVVRSGNMANSQFAGLSTAELEQRMREWREQRADSNEEMTAPEDQPAPNKAGRARLLHLPGQ